MITDVRGALATAANVAAMPTTAKAPGSISERDQTGSTSVAKPAPIEPPMKSAAMKVPTDPPLARVSDVATILSTATTNSDPQTSFVSDVAARSSERNF